MALNSQKICCLDVLFE